MIINDHNDYDEYVRRAGRHVDRTMPRPVTTSHRPLIVSPSESCVLTSSVNTQPECNICKPWSMILMLQASSLNMFVSSYGQMLRFDKIWKRTEQIKSLELCPIMLYCCGAVRFLCFSWSSNLEEFFFRGEFGRVWWNRMFRTHPHRSLDSFRKPRQWFRWKDTPDTVTFVRSRFLHSFETTRRPRCRSGGFSLRRSSFHFSNGKPPRFCFVLNTSSVYKPYITPP